MGDAKTVGMVWVAPEGEPSLPMIVTVGLEAIVKVVNLKGKDVSQLKKPNLSKEEVLSACALNNVYEARCSLGERTSTRVVDGLKMKFGDVGLYKKSKKPTTKLFFFVGWNEGLSEFLECHSTFLSIRLGILIYAISIHLSTTVANS